MGVIEVLGFAAQLGVGLLAASIWLLICKLIRALRRRSGFSYTGAGLVAFSTCLNFPAGPSVSGGLAGLIIMFIFFKQWRRALKLQSMEINTIISYEHQNFS